MPVKSERPSKSTENVQNKDKIKFVDLIDSPGLVGAAVDSEGSDGSL